MISALKGLQPLEHITSPNLDLPFFPSHAHCASRSPHLPVNSTLLITTRRIFPVASVIHLKNVRISRGLYSLANILAIILAI